MGKDIGVVPRQRWADRVNNNPSKCTQRVTIADSMDSDRWRNVLEAAKVLQGP